MNSDRVDIVTDQWKKNPTRNRKVAIFDEGDSFVWEDDEDLERFEKMVKYWLEKETMVFLLTATPYFTREGTPHEKQLIQNWWQFKVIEYDRNSKSHSVSTKPELDTPAKILAFLNLKRSLSPVLLWVTSEDHRNTLASWVNAEKNKSPKQKVFIDVGKV